MKILRLDLLAFGPFSGESLVLDEGGHGLHIVCGPNEAGKSSALRALRQLLYGIPHNSSDDFIHSYQNMRIGGLLESAEGTRLEIIRRKARKKDLRGPDDVEVVELSQLIDMLGGIDEATFEQQFGFDYEELSKGAEAVVQAAGDLGEILFAAGAGVADLGKVHTQINDEAEELFKPRGSKQRINKAISELDTHRRTIKELQLPTSKWVERNKVLRDAEKRQVEIANQLHDKRLEKNRLERIDKALPLIVRRKRFEEQLEKVIDARLLPEEFSANRIRATTERESAQDVEANASKEIEKFKGLIAGLDVPSSLLEHRTAIARLHSELGSFQKSARDRPGLVAQLEIADKQALAILQDLRCGPDLEDAEAFRLSSTQRQHIRLLEANCRVFVDKQANTDQSVRKLREEIQRAESRLAVLPATRDAGETQRTVRRARTHGDLDQHSTEACSTLRELNATANVDLGKLRHWSGTLEQLECLPVPALETIERSENDLADVTSAKKRIEERTSELTRQAQEFDQRLEQLRLEQDVPTEAGLVQARQRRDVGWQLVQQTWHDGQAVDDQSSLEFIDEFASGGDLSLAFQASVEMADAVADRLRREADRVAQKAKLTTDRQKVVRQLGEVKEELSSAEGEHESWQTQWCGQWAESGIDPGSPREMRSWLTQQKALVQIAENIRSQSNSLDEITELMRSLREELNRCLGQLDQAELNEADTLGETLERCEASVNEIEAANQQHQDHEEKLQALREGLPDAEEEAKRAQSELDQWRVDWGEAVAALGLDRNADTSEANSVMELADELLGLIEKSNDLRTVRIGGIDRDANRFSQSVERLVTQVAEDLAELPVEQMVADLHDRLEAANTAQTQLDGWTEQRDSEQSRHDTAHSRVERLDAVLETMCQQAGCAAPAELPDAEKHAAQRLENERELEAVNVQLDGLAAGGTLDEFIAEAEQFDPDQLQADLQGLVEKIAELDLSKNEAAQNIGSSRTELNLWDGSCEAAEAQERVEDLLARIHADAEQYIHLRLASVVLRRAIERFREENQGPVLDRASKLFAQLTLESFARLRVDYNDKGTPVLVGIRPDSERPVSVDGMSDGTCDQLYLSLRLASLESSLNGPEPLPFIVDDILIRFDDDRAVAALKALAHLSEKTQVIFFTHHEHLVRLARENLDDDVLFTHTFDHREPVVSSASSAES